MILINGTTGLPVTVPESLVERFKAGGFTEPPAPAAVEPVKTAPRKRRRTAKND